MGLAGPPEAISGLERRILRAPIRQNVPQLGAGQTDHNAIVVGVPGLARSRRDLDVVDPGVAILDEKLVVGGKSRPAPNDLRFGAAKFNPDQTNLHPARRLDPAVVRSAKDHVAALDREGHRPAPIGSPRHDGVVEKDRGA
jgi:hypothetical protein